jgi:8-amino-7-oxononanoate synthase
MVPSRETWLAALRAGLDRRRADCLLRELHPLESGTGPEVRIEDATYIQFCTNNYLGLASDPELIDAAREALGRWGAGGGASRVVAGSLGIHHELEAALARFKHAEAALVFPTGYMANLAVLTTFAGAPDLVVSDKLNHASLIDAARYAGARSRTFPHRRYERAAALLTKDASDDGGRFLVSDTVFSMDGDVADLPALCRAAEAAPRPDGARVIVDEAHATGVLGPRGAGLAELQGVEHRIDVTVGTLSKALGSLGGFVVGARPVIDTLINAARSFIYTTALPPACAAAALAALRIVEREPARRRRVCAMAEHVRRELRALGYDCGDSTTPIVPVILGDVSHALLAAEKLRQRGLFVPAIRPPTVPPNGSRLRLSIMTTHTDTHIERLLNAMRELAPELIER